VPNIAAAIVAANLAKTGPAINLKGFLVGNAWTNAFFDNTGAVQMWLDRGMISEEIFDGVTTTCNMSDVGPLLARWGRGGVAHGRAAPLGFVPLAGRPVAGGLDCDGWQNAAQTALGVIDIYDVFADACLGAETAPPAAVAGVSSNSAAGCAASYDPCIGDSTTAYLNRADVQKAIHVRPGTVPGGAWAGCSSVVSYSREDLLTSMFPVYDFLLTRAPGLAYLVFSGDVDGIVPFTGTRAWLTKGLAWPAATALHAWPAPDGQTGGWAYSFSHPTSGGKLQFASIRNAGHMTQATQQARALAMFRAYLAGKEL
jgi:serine carboxypeptidase-like clade 2